jgi:ribosomal protein L32
MPLVLVVAHRRVQIVDAITVVHLTICNNNGNNALSTRLSFSGLADSFAKGQEVNIMNNLSILHHLYYSLSI